MLFNKTCIWLVIWLIIIITRAVRETCKPPPPCMSLKCKIIIWLCQFCSRSKLDFRLWSALSNVTLWMIRTGIHNVLLFYLLWAIGGFFFFCCGWSVEVVLYSGKWQWTAVYVFKCFGHRLLPKSNHLFIGPRSTWEKIFVTIGPVVFFRYFVYRQTDKQTNKQTDRQTRPITLPPWRR